MPAKTHQDILLMRWALFSVAGLSLLVALYYLGLTPVWARELKEAMASAPFLLPPDAPAPVSYTHLDVYKRQYWSRPAG